MDEINSKRNEVPKKITKNLINVMSQKNALNDLHTNQEKKIDGSQFT